MAVLIRRINRQLTSFRKYSVPKHKNNPIFRNYVSTPEKSNTPNFHALEITKSHDFQRKIVLFLTKIEKSWPKLEEITQLVNDLEKSDLDIEPIICASLLRCCSESLSEISPKVRVNLANKIWNVLERKNCNLTIDLYNNLLKVYEKNKFPIQYRDFLEKMKVEPNQETFETLLRISANFGDLKSLDEILGLMRKKGFEENENILDSVILLHCNLGEVEKAMESMNSRKSISSNPGAKTLAHLALGLANIGDMKNLFEILETRILTASGIFQVLSSKYFSGNEDRIGEILDFLPEHISEKDSTVVKFVVELVFQSREKDAFFILKNIYSRKRNFEFPQYFLSSMVEANCETNLVVNMIKSTKNLEITKNAMLDLAEISLLKKQTSLSLTVFEHLKEMGQTIKPHFFWPLILNSRKKGDLGIMEILQKMKEFGVAPDFDTIFQYVLPHVNWKYPDMTYKRIVENSGPNPDLLTAFICFFLDKGFFGSAMTLVNHVPGKIDRIKVHEYLHAAYEKTNNIKKCGIFCKMLESKNESLKDFLSEDESNPSFVINQFLRIMRNELIRNSESFSKHPREMNVEELEQHLSELKRKKMNTRGVSRKLLQKYCSTNSIQQAEKIRQEFEARNFPYSIGMRSSLFGLYTNQKMMKKAQEQLDLITSQNPNFPLDDFKIVDFATVLISHNEMENAVKILENHNPIENSNIERNCWSLLNTLVHSENREYLEAVLDILLRKGYCKTSNVILGPLIRLHLIKGDVLLAVEKFGELVEKFGMTPLKQELVKHVIELEKFPEKSRIMEIIHDGVKKVDGQEIADACFAVALGQCGKLEEMQSFLSSNHVPVVLLDKHLKSVPEKDQLSTIKNILKVLGDTSTDVTLLQRSLIKLLYREGKFEEAKCAESHLEKLKRSTSRQEKQILNDALEIR